MARLNMTQRVALWEAIKRAKQRPCSLNEDCPLDPLNSCGVTREQYNAVRDHLARQYDLFTLTWVTPPLEAILADCQPRKEA